MNVKMKIPNAAGQLVWCPSDPSMGIGIVTHAANRQVRVHFLRLQQARSYTTRTQEHAILRYEIGAGEMVAELPEPLAPDAFPDVELEGEASAAPSVQSLGSVRVKRRIARPESPLWFYELEDNRQVAEDVLRPHVRDVGAKERLANLNLAHPEVVRARMQGLKLAHFGRRPGDSAILGTRVQWLAHQIDVATRAIARDPVRLLLADEVGLGKTVEAALIYAGLKYEGRGERVLILTPEPLCIQWLGEIYRKAHDLMVLLDTARLTDAQKDFPDLNPFEAHQRMVMPIEQLAQNAHLAHAAAQAHWDLVIIDEAHHLRWEPKKGGNAAYRLVEALAEKTRHLLLLTATPMALDPTEYHALLRLLDSTRFDNPKDFEQTAHRARDLRDVARQLAEQTDSEQALSSKLLKQAQALLNDDPEDLAALEALAACRPGSSQRVDQLSTVVEALRQRHGLTDYVVRNRRGPVGGLPQRQPEVVALTPSDAQDVLLEIGESVMFDLAQTIEDPQQQRRVIGELLRALWATPRALLDILRPYSKKLATELQSYVDAVIDAPLDQDHLPTGDMRLRWLVERVRALEPGEKLLVFVESSIAVRALKEALEPLLGGEIAMFHRDLAPRDQDRQVAYFRSPQGPQIMLSTEAGGEGRNFQFCHQVVLYDLPWRPATVEQRIGRIDRVGQTEHVRVVVPYFNSGYEAAVVKIMQQSIGVLDQTVGGIDHALEYVSDRLASLMLEGADAPAWKALFRQTAQLVADSKARIAADVDPILDHASFSAERVAQILQRVPPELEAQTEAFVQRYGNHSKIEMHQRGKQRLALVGAPSAAGREDHETGYTGTFSRTDALDHEDVEFLSFGHPLVEQALEWAQNADEASAGLALLRGCAEEGAAFVWSFDLDLPADMPEARTYFEQSLFTFALDEAGRRRQDLETLLTDGKRALDRMDASVLRSSIERWRLLVERNYESVEKLVDQYLEVAIEGAKKRFEVVSRRRLRDLQRAQRRKQPARQKKSGKKADVPSAADAAALAALEQENLRMRRAIEDARAHLVTAVAVRLLKQRHVSA